MQFGGLQHEQCTLRFTLKWFCSVALTLVSILSRNNWRILHVLLARLWLECSRDILIFHCLEKKSFLILSRDSLWNIKYLKCVSYLIFSPGKAIYLMSLQAFTIFSLGLHSSQEGSGLHVRTNNHELRIPSQSFAESINMVSFQLVQCQMKCFKRTENEKTLLQWNMLFGTTQKQLKIILNRIFDTSYRAKLDVMSRVPFVYHLGLYKFVIFLNISSKAQKSSFARESLCTDNWE